jgi:hypothetical protein
MFPSVNSPVVDAYTLTIPKHKGKPSNLSRLDRGLAVRRGLLMRLASPLGLSQHTDEHRPQRPVILASLGQDPTLANSTNTKDNPTTTRYTSTTVARNPVFRRIFATSADDVAEHHLWERQLRLLPSSCSSSTAYLHPRRV